MEHIRDAIDKARKEREAAQQQARPLVLENPHAENAMRTTGPSLPEIWKALPSFPVNEKFLARNMILTYQANAGAAPFDVLRTNMLHEMRSKKWRRVAITSPGSKCGKTTLCLNLAFSLARQSEIRIMVVELDLRRPAIARMLRLTEKVNFADALAGKEPPEKHIRRHGDNLAIACSHSPISSPAELLQGLAAAQIIDDLEARYQPDVMMFDMPPMLVADDTLAFIDQIDCALLVGAAEATTLDEISRCKQDLETRTNVMGVILNKCRYLDSAEGYRYGSY